MHPFIVQSIAAQQLRGHHERAERVRAVRIARARNRLLSRETPSRRPSALRSPVSVLRHRAARPAL